MKNKIYAILVLFILLLSSCVITSETSKFTLEQKIDDFNYLYKTLENNYPLFGVKNRIYKVNWLEHKDKYLQKIKESQTDKQFYTALHYIVQDLYDGHTHIVSPEYYNLLGSLIPKTVQSYPSNTNEYLIKPYKMSEESYSYWSKVLTEPNQIPITSSPISSISLKKLHSGNTIYIKFSSFLASEKDCEETLNFINQNISCQNIIIDIRNNYGGQDLQWQRYLVQPLLANEYQVDTVWAFRDSRISNKYVEIALKSYPNIKKITINELTNENTPPELASDFVNYLSLTKTYKPNSDTSFKGKIYVLVNRSVYSAAESFTSFCKKTGFATIVGESTLGDGGGSAPILVKLPNTGLLLRMRLQMILNPNGTANAEYGTVPDIYAEPHDVLNKTLRIIEGKE